MTEITMRDIENICVRFQSAQQSLGEAIWDEMAGVLSTTADRADFKLYIETFVGKLPEPKLISKPKNIIVPTDFYSAWAQILADMKIREDRVKASSNVVSERSEGKLGLLLEGASGVGKSTLLITAVEQMGFSLNAVDSQKRYYQITAGSANTEELLIKAFHEGSLVILDELNLKPETEKLLNQLLSGTDKSSAAANKAGFMVLATQNPPSYAGTKKLSTALVSRFHKIVMNKITSASVEAFAMESGHPQPNALARANEEMQAKYSFINTRHMFAAVGKYAKKESFVKEESKVKKSNKG